MKNRPQLLLIVGLIALAIGAFLYFSGGPPKADAALAAKCRASVAERGPGASDLAPKCDEQAFASMITATDATSAAQAISAANKREIGGSALSMGLLGFGAVLTLFGLFAVLSQRR